jgi:hypothetical protein
MIYSYLYINNYLKPALVLVATVDEPPFWKFGSFINVLMTKPIFAFLHGLISISQILVTIILEKHLIEDLWQKIWKVLKYFSKQNIFNKEDTENNRKFDI